MPSFVTVPTHQIYPALHRRSDVPAGFPTAAHRPYLRSPVAASNPLPRLRVITLATASRPFGIASDRRQGSVDKFFAHGPTLRGPSALHKPFLPDSDPLVADLKVALVSSCLERRSDHLERRALHLHISWRDMEGALEGLGFGRFERCPEAPEGLCFFWVLGCLPRSRNGGTWLISLRASYPICGRYFPKRRVPGRNWSGFSAAS